MVDERRQAALLAVEQGSAFSVQFVVLTILSCVLATLGLITNSIAVIIGAMLVAPLMTPILGIALASIRDAWALYFRSLALIGVAVVMSVGLAACVARLADWLPLDAFSSVPAEVDIRSHPSVFDLGVALAGGAAGAYSVVRIPSAAPVIGVAVATALMPPLCSSGIGLALWDGDVFRGAFLLFLTNLVAISFAAMAVFWGLGFRSRNSGYQVLQAAIASASIVILAGTLFGLGIRTIAAAREDDRVRAAATSSLEELIPGSELLSLTHENSGEALHIRMRVQVPEGVTAEDVRRVQERIADDLDRSLQLTFVGVPTLSFEAIPPAAARTETPIPSPTATASSTPTSSPTRTPQPTATPSPTPPPAVTVPAVGNSPPGE